jgi:hypothetical protein
LSGNNAQLSVAESKILALLDPASPFFGVAELGNNKQSHQMLLTFDNGSDCNFNPTTQVDGWRCNLLFFDEEGKITEKDTIQKNKNAYKVTKGTYKWPIRVRHFTTLSLGTPSIAVEKYLKPRGLVLYFPATDPRNPNQHREFPDICTWVVVTEDDLRLGEGNVQSELLCHAAPEAGSIWIRDIEILDTIPEFCIPPLSHGLYARLTIDWNASAGHACEVIITDGEDYWIVDEWSGTDLGVMARFINDQRRKFGQKLTVIYEWQGGDTQCLKYDLETYHDCPLDTPDAWDRLVQGIKIPLVQGLGERGKIHAYKGAKHFIEQQPAVFLDEKGKIPESATDHALVSFAHGVEPPTEAAVIPMSFKVGTRA